MSTCRARTEEDSASRPNRPAITPTRRSNDSRLLRGGGDASLARRSPAPIYTSLMITSIIHLQVLLFSADGVVGTSRHPPALGSRSWAAAGGGGAGVAGGGAAWGGLGRDRRVGGGKKAPQVAGGQRPRPGPPVGKDAPTATSTRATSAKAPSSPSPAEGSPGQKYPETALVSRKYR